MIWYAYFQRFARHFFEKRRVLPKNYPCERIHIGMLEGVYPG